MRKISSITILILLFTFKVKGQCQDHNFANKRYPGTCVYNAIKWFNMSSENWTTDMKKWDFGNTGFSEEGLPFFSSSNTHWDIGVQLIITKGSDRLEIINMPISDYKKDVFQNIIKELSPFFSEKNEVWNFFTIKYTDNITYEFAVHQDGKMDLIRIKKIK